MNPFVVKGLLEAGKKLIDHFFPDPQQAADAKMKLLEMQQKGELALLAAETDLAKLQIQVNVEEAKSTNWFVAGWRPCVGWVCAAAFAYAYILLPFLQFFVYAFGTGEMVKQFALLPTLDLAAMLPVLFGMLGLSHHRTDEKKTGSESNR